jgi:hypothetical protein
VGNHAAFFESMQARLSAVSPNGDTRPLDGLKTRLSGDPSIGLLDSAATMLDVLTFYQERIANEGYLRTATERLSVLELGRLVGYKPRPGVASSVYLAYTMEETSEPALIPEGALAKSVPAPGELSQSFETSEKIEARKEWNDLAARRSRPQMIVASNAKTIGVIYFEGVETNLKTNDPLLFTFGGERPPVVRRVETVEVSFEEKKTKVTLQFTSVFSPLLALIEKYLGNYKAYGLDERDELVGRALGVLDDLADVFDEDESIPDLEEMFGRMVLLVIDIDASGNNCLQKWFASLVENVINVVLESERDLEFTGMLGIANVDPEDEQIKKALGILRGYEGFDTLLLNSARVAVTTGTGSVAAVNLIRDLFGAKAPPPSPFANLLQFTAPLTKPPSRQPRNSVSLDRDVQRVLDVSRDTLPKILTSFKPGLRDTAYKAWSGTRVKPGPDRDRPAKVYALRTTASLFGSTVQPRILDIERPSGRILRTGEYAVASIDGVEYFQQTGGFILNVAAAASTDITMTKHEEERSIFLDATYDKVVAGSWVVIDTSQVDRDKLTHFTIPLADPAGDPDVPSQKTLVVRAEEVLHGISRSEYGFGAKATRIRIGTPWIDFPETQDELEEIREIVTETNPGRRQDLLDNDFSIIRNTLVYTQSEELALADEPVKGDVCGELVELGALYDGLQSGMWVIVSGERTDIPGATGIMGAELAMLRDIRQDSDPDLPGDKTHTTLIFANKLNYTYKRETVVIYGNVVKATHGETRNEVLGSGDAARALQAFVLKQPPLTFVSAPNAEGIDSTLHVRVNDVEWYETDSLAGLGKTDRNFVTKTDDEAKTTVVFGNGERGARLPTGVENIAAVYRNGIGKGGNVGARQISIPVTKPLGVKEVINPIRASGGADRETRDQARRNVPIALRALDRLVSTRDYADFARTFAGIGKARSARLKDVHRPVVHVTIAGVDDIPIDANSDLYRNLKRAFAKNGDPHQAVRVDTRELVALIISANVSIGAEYKWESVEPKIRAALLDTFSFERRELGQSAFLSEVIGTIQSVTGVRYVDVDVFDSLSETEILDPDAIIAKIRNIGGTRSGPGGASEPFSQPRPCIPVALASDSVGGAPIGPAQLAYLLPGVADTLILNQIKEEVNK